MPQCIIVVVFSDKDQLFAQLLRLQHLIDPEIQLTLLNITMGVHTILLIASNGWLFKLVIK